MTKLPLLSRASRCSLLPKTFAFARDKLSIALFGVKWPDLESEMHISGSPFVGLLYRFPISPPNSGHADPSSVSKSNSLC